MNLTPEIIIKEVAKYFGLTVEQVLAKGRLRENAMARFIAMFFIRKYCKLSWVKIGEYFLKDHATVIHGVRQVRNLLQFDKELQRDIEQLKEIFLNIGPEIDDFYGVFGWYDYFPLPEKYEQPEIDFSTPFKSPFADRESCANRAYSGYKAVV